MSPRKTLTSVRLDHETTQRVLEKAAGKRLDSLYVRVFMYVAEAGRGVTNLEVERALNLSKNSASRGLNELSPVSWRKHKDTGHNLPGLGWVSDTAAYGRESSWELSTAGKGIYNQLRKAHA